MGRYNEYSDRDVREELDSARIRLGKEQQNVKDLEQELQRRGLAQAVSRLILNPSIGTS